jgi:hypothetical protein
VPDGTIGPWAKIIDGSDVVVNLSGESIAPRRWASAQQTRIRDNRIHATRSIVAAIHAVDRKPTVLLNASAVGYYGSHGDERLTEESRPGSDFLASVCRDWEAEALAAADESRVVLLRSAPVLDSGGGCFRKSRCRFDCLSEGRLALALSTGRGFTALTG